MKYFVRSVKYFFYFSALTSLILAALVATGMADSDINEMFRGGYSAIWKIAAFYVCIAAVYPKVGFIRRKVSVQNEWKDVRPAVITFLQERHYELESEADGSLTFRHKGNLDKLKRMYEDRITVTAVDGGFIMEGLRKDVFRLACSLEYKLNPQQED